MLDDSLDIEASIIYNLYEIVPLTKWVSVDYLRYYFWCDRPVAKQRREFADKGEAESPGILFLLWSEQNLCDELEDETRGLLRTMLDCDYLKNEDADIDSFEKHSELISMHNKMLEAEARKLGTLFVKAAFGSDDYDRLNRLEKQTVHQLHVRNKKEAYHNRPIDTSSYSGFVSELERFEADFRAVKDSGGQRVYNLPLKVLEVVLRAKLFCRLGGDAISNKTMMRELVQILQDNWENLCNVNYTERQKNDLVNSIFAISRERNRNAHGIKGYSLEKADELMKKMYAVIGEIIQVI